MSKCSRCGRELVTGDVHWDMGLCNGCWNVLFEQAKQKEPITMQILGNWVKCPDCEQKNHRIAVLESEIRADERRKVCEIIRRSLINEEQIEHLIDKIEQNIKPTQRG